MESLFRRYLEFSMMLAIKIIFHFIIEKNEHIISHYTLSSFYKI